MSEKPKIENDLEKLIKEVEDLKNVEIFAGNVVKEAIHSGQIMAYREILIKIQTKYY